MNQAQEEAGHSHLPTPKHIGSLRSAALYQPLPDFELELDVLDDP